MGRFIAGHKGLKPKGVQHKRTKDLKQRAEQVARKIGGKGGLEAFLKTRPKLLDDLLRDAARDKVAAVDAAGRPVASAPVVDTINIVSIPRGWAVTGLLGRDAHLPTETLMQLRKLLPRGSIHRPPSLDGELPAPLLLDEPPLVPPPEDEILSTTMPTVTDRLLRPRSRNLRRVAATMVMSMNSLLRGIPQSKFPKPRD